MKELLLFGCELVMPVSPMLEPPYSGLVRGWVIFASITHPVEKHIGFICFWGWLAPHPYYV